MAAAAALTETGIREAGSVPLPRKGGGIVRSLWLQTPREKAGRGRGGGIIYSYLRVSWFVVSDQQTVCRRWRMWGSRKEGEKIGTMPSEMLKGFELTLNS